MPQPRIKRGALTTILSLLVLITAQASAEDEDRLVDLVPRWKEGEKLQYELVKTRRKLEGGELTLNARSRTSIIIEVLKGSDVGYVLRWTMGETKLDDPTQAANPLVRAMSNLTKGFKILLEVDSRGTLVGVQNWRQLQETSSKVIDRITAELQNAGLQAALIEKIPEQVKSMVATKEQVEQLCTKEPQMFLLALGRAYSTSDPIVYQDQLPNPFGGDPLPSLGVFSLEKLDTKSNMATVTWKQTIDPVSAKRVIQQTVKDLAVALGRSEPDANVLESMTVAIEDTAVFSLSISSGWPRRLTHTRTTKIGDKSQEDSISFERKE